MQWIEYNSINKVSFLSNSSTQKSNNNNSSSSENKTKQKKDPMKFKFPNAIELYFRDLSQIVTFDYIRLKNHGHHLLIITSLLNIGLHLKQISSILKWLQTEKKINKHLNGENAVEMNWLFKFQLCHLRFEFSFR